MENQAPYQAIVPQVASSTDSENLIMTSLIHATLMQLRMDHEEEFRMFVRYGKHPKTVYKKMIEMLDQYGAMRELEGRKIGAKLTETADIEEIIMEANNQLKILKELL